jgi:hypothetical protein
MGQTGERPYGERQRRPGDYEVQVSQRPIAVHALENLASSDRGVAMLRRLIREGIRGAAAERAPRPLPAGYGGCVPTFCQDTVWPAAGNAAPLAEFGAAVADSVLASALDNEAERCARLRTVLQTRFGSPDRQATGGESLGSSHWSCRSLSAQRSPEPRSLSRSRASTGSSRLRCCA